MKLYCRHISALMAIIVAAFGNPYTLYRALNTSSRATLYLDVVDHDEDLFVRVETDGNPEQPELIHHEESNRDSGSKSQLLKNKWHLFLSFVKIGHGASLNFVVSRSLLTWNDQEVIGFIFHPPNRSV